MTRVRADDLLYPAIFFYEDRFRICKDSRSVVCEGGGLLVDGAARCYRVISAENPFFKDGRWLTRDERRRVTDLGKTLLCEGEPFSTSLDELRRKIVWLVSARGHFESAAGFGLPADVDTASTVYELLEIMAGLET